MFAEGLFDLSVAGGWQGASYSLDPWPDRSGRLAGTTGQLWLGQPRNSDSSIATGGDMHCLNFWAHELYLQLA